jgi:hypothetical protein
MEKRKVVKCVIDESGRLGITAMGLVDIPAIEENWIALSKQMQLASVNDERKMLYGPALIPDKQILRYDDQGEPYYVYFEKSTVEAIAHQFFKKNLQHTTNLQHEVPVTGVTVVESWIKEGNNDKSIELGLPELPDGTWFIGTKVDDASVWNDVKDGKVKGYSIEGFFNEVGVSMSGVRNYEAELLLELEAILGGVISNK